MPLRQLALFAFADAAADIFADATPLMPFHFDAISPLRRYYADI
jgi:hypothetical protein